MNTPNNGGKITTAEGGPSFSIELYQMKLNYSKIMHNIAK